MAQEGGSGNSVASRQEETLKEQKKNEKEKKEEHLRKDVFDAY